MSELVKRTRYSCKYPNCSNVYYIGCEKHFFKFSRDESLRNEWKKNCNIGHSVNCSNYRICEDHFNDSDFYNETKTKLLNYSVPRPFSIESNNALSQPGGSSSIQDNLEILSVVSHSNSNFLHVLEDHHYALPYTDGSVINPVESVSNLSFSHVIENHNYALPHTEGSVITAVVSDKRVAGISKKDLTPTEKVMHDIHRKAISKVSKLKHSLQSERNRVKVLKKLNDDGKFQILENDLNFVTKSFINSQLKNVKKSPNGRRWTVQDKTFALAIYKMSPRSYRYISNYFLLPSPRTLKSLLSRIPFECGINTLIMDCLSQQVDKMNPLDRHCVLLFDEMKLDSGLHFEHHKGYISGFVDLGHLGRQNKFADHALVFMARGIRKSWKQVIAYYFTCKTVSTISLKLLVQEIIGKLQNINLKVVATVCDQGTTNQAALKKLIQEDINFPDDPFSFSVNGESICVIYDVPHLLKNTRNALLRCGFRYNQDHKVARFKYIQLAFDMDQAKRTYKMLPRLKPEYFNFKDSWVKMKVKIAARQLSYSVASAIETWVAAGAMSAEGAHTAEFVHKIDCLFDSLNGYSLKTSGGRPFKSVLRDGSPHLEFWSEMVDEIKNWQLIELKTGKDVTNEYSFISGWLISIRSIRCLWNRLKELGFSYFNLRSFNQDALENLFAIVRQHGISNTNPTCHQFVAALKTAVVNNLSMPVYNGNCEEDGSLNLNNLSFFLEKTSQKGHTTETAVLDSCNSNVEPIPSTSNAVMNESEHDVIEEPYLEATFISELLSDNPINYATSYVAGYILKKIRIPECETCSKDLISEDQNESHLFITFKEFSEYSALNYPAKKVTDFVEAVDILVQEFLSKQGHEIGLQEKFTALHYSKFLTLPFCSVHSCRKDIFEKCVRLCFYKFIKEKKIERKNKLPSAAPSSVSVSSAHLKKNGNFLSLKVVLYISGLSVNSSIYDLCKYLYS